VVERLPIVTFTIPGEPFSKERPRWGGRRTYTPPKTVAAESRVIEAFDIAYPLGLPLACELGMRIDFHLGTRRRKDIDNMQKLVMDALNKVAYEDDWQIAELTSRRHYDKGNPRTEVSIWVDVDVETVA
jgi:Holliday junction resolvase RusA-like endonuclease